MSHHYRQQGTSAEQGQNWSSEQEDLFQKVISGKEVNTEDITQIFPVYKLQHFGHLANTPLPVTPLTESVSNCKFLISAPSPIRSKSGLVSPEIM